MARYRVLVLAHRLSPQAKESGSRVGSAVMEMRVVRAATATYARDLALMQVMTASALLIDAPVVTDAVLVERLRFGRKPVREHLLRNHPRRANGPATREQSVGTHLMRRARRGISNSVSYCLPLTGLVEAL